MLKLLLDEHVARAVASGVRRRLPAIAIDALVTYDRRTIPILLKGWAEQGLQHSGVIFVDERTIAPSDVGGLVRALAELCVAAGEWDWTDRVVFLKRGS